MPILQRYSTTLQFKCDRKLTEKEISLIEGALRLQLEEPWDDNQEDMDISIKSIEIETKHTPYRLGKEFEDSLVLSGYPIEIAQKISEQMFGEAK